jgi:hypothetical protein
MNENKIIGFVIGICVVLIILSLILSFADVDFPGPADWLLSWTSWIGSVVGIVVAARVLWKTPSLIREFLDRGKNPSG